MLAAVDADNVDSCNLATFLVGETFFTCATVVKTRLVVCTGVYAAVVVDDGFFVLSAPTTVDGDDGPFSNEVGRTIDGTDDGDGDE